MVYFFYKSIITKTSINNCKITKECLIELGGRLYAKITEVVIPDKWTSIGYVDKYGDNSRNHICSTIRHTDSRAYSSL